MKKAFTLIELLAVIVIIAIIATIGVFSITKIMNKARLNTLQDSALSAKKAGQLYMAQNPTETNAEITLDFTPGSGIDQNLLDLSKDPWGDPYLSVLVKINRISDSKFSYTVYFTTEHGCYILNDGATEMISSACASYIVKYFTGATSTDSNLNGLSHNRSLVRDTDNNLHLVYNDNPSGTNSYYIKSSNQGLTWSSTETLTGLPVWGIAPYIKIDNNNRINVFNNGGYSDNGGIIHYYKDKNGGWLSAIIGVNHPEEVYYMANPAVGSNNNLYLTYGGMHWSGQLYREWDGNSWSGPTTLDSSPRDIYYQNTLIIGSNLYSFYMGGSNDTYLWMNNRIDDSWTGIQQVTDFSDSSSYNTIVDKDDNIWLFIMDKTSTPIISARKFNTTTNTWGSWITLDSEAGKTMGYPSATVDSKGNIYVFYNLEHNTDQWQILYKKYDYTTKVWGSRTEFTKLAEDGSCFNPKVRYQKYHHFNPDQIDLSYRQNTLGDTSVYKLYYGGLKAN